VWEFFSITSCECGRLPWLSGPSGGNSILLDGYESRFWRLFRSWNEQAYTNVWLDLIQEYTELFLTYEADRLPAVSGLASRLLQLTGDKYLAGHWRVDLQRSLAWARKDKLMCSRRHSAPLKAPSWSWASVATIGDTAAQAIRFPWRKGSTDSLDLDKLLKILQASCVPLGANRFGNVSGVSIHN
jgi:hypothetical protein